MQAVLVVESHRFDFEALRDRLRCRYVRVADPLAAVHALHAAQFQMVVVPGGSEEEPGYRALFSSMRLIAPASTLLCMQAKAAQSRDPAPRPVEMLHD